MKKGLIQIYTGDGKGKTTAVVGLAVRALAGKLKVAYIYFHKNPKRRGYGELKILKKLGVDIFSFASKHPCMDKNLDADKLRRECLQAIEFIKKIYNKKKYDLLILDEIIISVRDGFLKKSEINAILDSKPKGLELVLTGRGATKGIVEKADLVSRISKIKHPYDLKLKAREGIEY